MVEKDAIYEWMALYYVCEYHASLKDISKLIEVGGKELVLEKSKNGGTALHTVSYNNASIEIILKLIEVGGDKLLSVKNSYGTNLLVYSIFKKRKVELGQEEEEEHEQRKFNDIFVLVVKECISAQIGREFRIGGLFNIELKKWRKWIYRKWELFAPLLQLAIADLEKMPPVLHAAIIAKAPQNIIVDIINRFDCICTTDSLNRYPIDVAIEEGLVDGCNNGT